MNEEIQKYINQADSLYEAFGQEFKRFELLLPKNFLSQEFVDQIEGITLEGAELALKDLDDLRVKYLGDKSEIKRLVYEIESRGGRVLFTQDVIEQQQLRLRRFAEISQKEQEKRTQQKNGQEIDYQINYTR